jgi:hypothetical protein
MQKLWEECAPEDSCLPGYGGMISHISKDRVAFISKFNTAEKSENT